MSSSNIPTDAKGNKLPYRVVFGDAVTVGTVLYVKCGGGPTGCPSKAEHHHIGRWHQDLVIGARWSEGAKEKSLIVSDENGYQHASSCPTERAVHIALPAPAAAEAAVEQESNPA